ncbi:NADH-ubiquinone/plastoquinone oxidoreductase chain 6 [Thermobaculum terrenum ATCC BAA-798]|uniref:NADH-quinone oxidoreductase subunit J n=1 Tax=Thermobaculum terrenum (strain ATCC BAA-798 / CCMEE 7001 / YNP1) TaxID=525904 RepID=D1CCC6_THET1|nr:NADH-quinone oxidoreductase subunit J [Thermobaculum terrenum]ACZ42441.1 NADH-ubiquinone/plastoquinone oxidoreductase chain 6 [Thermobaculum terrenum ATCC BAA-798]
MDLVSWLFILFAVIGLLGAVMVVVARNPVHCVLFMLLTFVNIAAMFVLLDAQFIAILQVLVYSGAILVLFLFVVMLLQQAERPIPMLAARVQLPVALVVGGLFLLEIIVVTFGNIITAGRKGGDTPQAIAQAGGNVQALGEQLFTRWLLPFEIASVLLLVAAIGALYLAKEDL